MMNDMGHPTGFACELFCEGSCPGYRRRGEFCIPLAGRWNKTMEQNGSQHGP